MVSDVADESGVGSDERMTRPQRFPLKLEFWTDEQQVEALDRLTASARFTRADYLREALTLYLIHKGFPSAPPPQPNGQSHQEATHGL